MRVALISTMAEAASGAGQGSDGDVGPLAFARMGARTLAAHQVDVVLALGAQRVVVFCHGIGPDVLELQHAAEARGASFHAINGVRPLSGLVSAADELLVLGDCIIADAAEIEEALGDRAGVLVLPADPAIRLGYERIDGERAWAGAMVLRGQAVERLTELPGDVEPASALLRIALQGGARCVELPATTLDSGEWLLAREAPQVEAAARRRMERNLAAQGWFAPGIALADRTTARLAESLFDRGFGKRAVEALALVVLGCSLAWGWAMSVSAGMVGLAGSAFLFAGAAALDRLERDGRPARRRADLLVPLAIDAGFLFLASLPWPNAAWDHALFAPIMLLGWLHILESSGEERIAALARDRILLAMVLALAGFGGVLHPAIRLLAVVAMAATLWLSLRKRLTRA
ncbi:MAG: hypothetical protein IE933_02195 [Sphingomonadales bacterium]|nr:hypothetical protein [Sphingomonadales bacterium]MBD3772224.1 hypothetical protein [Paracoccaceae bacterium]